MSMIITHNVNERYMRRYDAPTVDPIHQRLLYMFSPLVLFHWATLGWSSHDALQGHSRPCIALCSTRPFKPLGQHSCNVWGKASGAWVEWLCGSVRPCVYRFLAWAGSNAASKRVCHSFRNVRSKWFGPTVAFEFYCLLTVIVHYQT